MEPDKQTFDTTPPKTIADSKLVRNGVFIGSAVIGLATAVISIWDEFYDDVKKRAPIKTMREERNAKIDGINLQGMLAPTESKYLAPEKVLKGVQEANAEYAVRLRETLPKIGVPKGLIKGTYVRAKDLGPYNLGTIAMKTGASLALTIGGYYLINQNVRLKASNSQQDQNIRALGQRIDAAEQRRSELFERGVSASR